MGPIIFDLFISICILSSFFCFLTILFYAHQDINVLLNKMNIKTQKIVLGLLVKIIIKHILHVSTLRKMLLLLWRSIASDEDVSESYGVSAAQSWTRKCDHTGGMQQQPLGQVFFLCGPGAYDRDPANVSF